MSKLSRLDPTSLRGNPRCTYAAWLKYQPMVLAAMRQHPRPYRTTPKNMSAASVASKCRDAIRGRLAFGYDCEVSLEEMLRWYSEIIIKHDNDSVYIGTPDQVQKQLELTDVNPTASPSLSFDTLSFEEVSAFQLLLSTNRLVGPIIIRNPPDITLLPERANVEMIYNDKVELVMF